VIENRDRCHGYSRAWPILQ